MQFVVQQLTSWSRYLVENLTFSQSLENSLPFCVTLSFVTMLKEGLRRANGLPALPFTSLMTVFWIFQDPLIRLWFLRTATYFFVPVC